jgi:glycosyl transferase family 1
MRIGFASVDWSHITPTPTPGGAGYYRCALPARGLASLGHETWHGRLAIHEPSGELCVGTWDGEIHGELDAIVLQRYMGDDAEPAIRRARSLGQIIVNDLDDWFFGLDQSNRAFWSSHPKHNAEINRSHYQRILAASDALIASTPYLAARLERLFPGMRVVTLRNMIDLDRWKAEPVRRTRHGLVVGWVGATSWRSGDLEVVRGILQPWLARYGARFYHGGHHDAAQRAGELLGLTGEYETRPMAPIGEYPKLLQGIDIGIAPMRETPFNFAKSAIKGMEYSAAGIPYVASRTPEYEWFGQGVLARRPHDWMRGLTRLLDPDERTRIANAARQRVESESLEQRSGEWERFLLELVRRKDKRGIPQTIGR